jgi:hypothetical protein
VFFYGKPFLPSQMFAMWAGAYPSDKRFSLFWRKISVKDKHSYNIGIGLSMLKTLFKFRCSVLLFYPSKFQASLMFAMRAGAYPNDKHSSLFCQKISSKEKHSYKIGIDLSMLKTLFKF